MSENDHQFLLNAYRSARDELIERLRIRERIIAFYIGASSALFAVQFGENDIAPNLSQYVYVILPLLALFAALTVSVQTSVIGGLGHFCAIELSKEFQRIGAQTTLQWDNSNELRLVQRNAVIQRSTAHGVILIAPPLVSLFWAWRSFSEACSCGYDLFTTWDGIVWTIALAITIIAWIIHQGTIVSRIRLYRDRFTTTGQDGNLGDP